MEFFKVPVPSYRKKGIYDDSHLKPIEGVKLRIFSSPRAFILGERYIQRLDLCPRAFLGGQARNLTCSMYFLWGNP